MTQVRDQSYRERVAAAYRAAWVLQALAWTTVVVGVLSLGVTAVAYFTGVVGGPAAFGTIVGTALGSILAGGTAHASATNLGIAGARLEIAIGAAERGESEEPVDLAL